MTSSSIFPPKAVAAALIRWVPSDDEDLHRCCYITNAVQAFLAAPRAQLPDWGTLRPAQQLASKLDAFVGGDHLAALGMQDSPPAFRKLRPRGANGPNVWELRTWDVRLFGWFPGPLNTFVGVAPALKKDLLLPDGSENSAAYQAHIDEVVTWRLTHGLEQHVWKLTEDDLPLFLKR